MRIAIVAHTYARMANELRLRRELGVGVQSKHWLAGRRVGELRETGAARDGSRERRELRETRAARGGS